MKSLASVSRAVLGVSLLASLAGAQAPATAQKPVQFGAGVSLVSVPVFVTDAAGKPLTGLDADDFEIQDEGKTVPVVSLHEIDLQSPAVEEQVRRIPAARRQFLLLFDLSFSTPSGIVRSREAAIDFVQKSLLPSDLAGVATYSSVAGVKLLVGFTSDREQIRQAIETLDLLKTERKPDMLGLAFQLREALPGTAGGGPADDRGGVKGDQAFAQELQQLQVRFRQAEESLYRAKVGNLIDGMNALATALNAVQGRKQIIYLSGGFADSTLTGAQGAVAAQNSQAVVEGRIWDVSSESHFGDSAVRSQLDTMLRSFSGADCVVHTVDVTGLSARGADLEAQEATEQRGAGGRETLARIAQGTGGRMIKDANELGSALNELMNLSRHYYVLAFEPAEAKGAGKFHKLKVRVKEKAKSVSHRPGYYERAPYEKQAPLARRLEAAEAIAKGWSGGAIAVGATVLPYRSAEGKASVPVVFEIEGSSLLDRGKQGDELPLEIYGYAFDEQGKIEDLMQLGSKLQLSKVGGKLRESGMQVQTSFALSPGKHRLRFMARDSATGRAGAYGIDVEVPTFAPGSVVLNPPMFMDDPARWLVLQVPSRSVASPEIPFRVAEDLFAPRSRPRLANGRLENVCVLVYDGGAQYGAGASFELKAQMLDAGGTPVPFGKVTLAKSVAETDGFRRFVLSFTPTNVPPGDYTFKVKFRPPNAEQPSEATQAVTVE